jgi:hypothetical protein
LKINYFTISPTLKNLGNAAESIEEVEFFITTLQQLYVGLGDDFGKLGFFQVKVRAGHVEIEDLVE